MARLSISQAAKIYGKDRKTISRHIDEGKLSCEVNAQGHKLIDMAELVREYGEPKRNPALASVGRNGALPQRNASDAPVPLEYKISVLEEKNKALDEQLKREREEYRVDQEERRDREKELREIIKTQTHLLEDKREKNDSLTEPLNSQSLSWVNAVLIGCGVVITIALVFVAWVLPHLA